MPKKNNHSDLLGGLCWRVLQGVIDNEKGGLCCGFQAKRTYCLGSNRNPPWNNVSFIVNPVILGLFLCWSGFIEKVSLFPGKLLSTCSIPLYVGKKLMAFNCSYSDLIASIYLAN